MTGAFVDGLVEAHCSKDSKDSKDSHAVPPTGTHPRPILDRFKNSERKHFRRPAAVPTHVTDGIDATFVQDTRHSQ